LQYILSNKVSIEELQRIMDNKANSHEINMEVSQLQARVDDTFQELSKRVSQCALSQDMSYFHSLLETKANIEEVNESLSNKASKTSVANALHRKANRTDIDELLALKVDCLDLEKVVAALEQKADIDAVDAVRREIGTKVDR
jgi:D-alanyl-D-alanine dipeptidase